MPRIGGRAAIGVPAKSPAFRGRCHGEALAPCAALIVSDDEKDERLHTNAIAAYCVDMDTATRKFGLHCRGKVISSGR